MGSGRNDVLDVHLGTKQADLVVTGGRIVDVFRKELRHADIAVKAKRIVRVGDVTELQGEATRVVNAEGKIVTPGLIESHAHSYHANLSMTEYAKLCLTRGTTAVAESFYGQGQIRGIEAVKFFYDELRQTPLKLLFLVPVLAYLQNVELGLPSTPGAVTGDDLLSMLDWEGCCGLEEPPYIPVRDKDPVIIKLIDEALERGMVVMGHGAGLDTHDLAAYAAYGITADHECITAEEAVERVRNGMMVSFRETPIARNQRDVQAAVTELGCDPHLFMFSSDVPDAVSFARAGHIDEFIRIAVKAGIDPIDAVCMGSINTARYYRVDHEIGSLTPGRRADLLLVDDLERFTVDVVIANGDRVVANGRWRGTLEQPEYPDFLRDTVTLSRPVKPEALALPAPGGADRVTVRVIGAESLLSDERQIELAVVDGAVQADIERDVLKVAMFDRYARWDEPAIAFMQGFALKRGAIGTSYNPFFNNILVLGTNDTDLALAANEVARLGGGFVAVQDGEVLGSVALPLCGLLSDRPVDEVVPALESLYQAVADMGCAIEWPFHNLAFTAVVGELPQLKLSDKGLFDVVLHEHLTTIVE